MTWLWGESGDNGKECVYSGDEVTMMMMIMIIAPEIQCNEGMVVMV